MIAVFVVAAAIALSSVLGLIERYLSLWERAQALAPWAAWVLLAATVVVIALLLVLLAWMLWPSAGKARQPSKPIGERVKDAASAGIDVSAAQAELRTLEQRQHAGTLYVAVFGHISSGKSSLIRALAPDAKTTVSATGGTTVNVEHHMWSSPAGDTVLLADVPGTQDSATRSATAMAEARRAHVVIYICDGDLSASQWNDVQTLIAHGKPMLIALNKQDRYAADALDQLREHIAQRFPRRQRPGIVPCSAGGQQAVVLTDADGNSREDTRARPPAVDALRAAINDMIREDPAALTALRDNAVFAMAGEQLDQAQRSHRRAEADQIVARHTRAAVVGALAAISPGSDLVIQGVIGAKLVRDLCKLFDVRARDVDTDALLKAAGSRARNSSALVLAVAGNGLKAFPGVGTVSGGLTHAVAYGLLFDAFGRALVRTLIDQGALDQDHALSNLDTALGEPLPARARRIAALALDLRKPADD